MFYVPFHAEKIVKKGTINVLQGGGGQRSMVKDHTLTIFFGTLPLLKFHVLTNATLVYT